MPVPVAMKTASLDGIADGEKSQRRGHLDGIARLHREKVWCENAFVYQIQAQLKAIAIRQRDDGIGARYLLAVDGFLERNELAGLEMQLLHFWDFEHKVAHFRRDIVKFDHPGLHTGS